MAYYVKFPNTDTFGLEIQGIVGAFNVQYTMREDVPNFTIGRFLLDASRVAGSTVSSGNGGLQQTSSGVFGLGGIAVSNILINNIASTGEDLFNANYGDLCAFDYGDGTDIPSEGCVMLGAKSSENNSFEGWAISNLQITDDNGTHKFYFNATDNIYASTSGLLTLTMINPPIDNSHLIYFSDTGVNSSEFYDRNFITFNSISQTYCELAEQFQPTGNYSIKAKVFFDGSNFNITANDADSNSRFWVSSDGSISWRANTSSSLLQSSTGIIPLNKLSTVYCERISNSGVIKVNGETVASGIVPTGTPAIQNIGKASTIYSDGKLADIELTDLIANKTQTYAIDSETLDYELPKENEFGADLSEYISISGGWTESTSGVYDWASASNETSFVIGENRTTVNSIVNIKFKVSNFTGSGNFGLSADTSSSFVDGRITGNGIVNCYVALNGSSPNGIKLFARSSHTLTISNISVREVTSALIYKNFSPANTEGYSFDTDLLAWVGASDTMPIAYPISFPFSNSVISPIIKNLITNLIKPMVREY